MERHGGVATPGDTPGDLQRPSTSAATALEGESAAGRQDCSDTDPGSGIRTGHRKNRSRSLTGDR